MKNVFFWLLEIAPIDEYVIRIIHLVNENTITVAYSKVK